MKRVTIRFRAANKIKREQIAKKLSRFLDELRASGKSDEETAVELHVSRDTVYAWRMGLRFPKMLVIQGIEKQYGAEIL